MCTRKLDFEETNPPGPRLGSVVIERHDRRFDYQRSVFRCRANGIVGVIGPTHAGKTTLSKTIVGLEPLDGGEPTIAETVD